MKDRSPVENQIYHRIEDQLLVVMKSIPLSEKQKFVRKAKIQNEIEIFGQFSPFLHCQAMDGN
jgi:hypothetical protein